MSSVNVAAETVPANNNRPVLVHTRASALMIPDWTREWPEQCRLTYAALLFRVGQIESTGRPREWLGLQNMDQIRRLTGQSPRSIKRAMSWLRAEGFVTNSSLLQHDSMPDATCEAGNVTLVARRWSSASSYLPLQVARSGLSTHAKLVFAFVLRCSKQARWRGGAMTLTHLQLAAIWRGKDIESMSSAEMKTAQACMQNDLKALEMVGLLSQIQRNRGGRVRIPNLIDTVVDSREQLEEWSKRGANGLVEEKGQRLGRGASVRGANHLVPLESLTEEESLSRADASAIAPASQPLELPFPVGEDPERAFLGAGANGLPAVGT